MGTIKTLLAAAGLALAPLAFAFPAAAGQSDGQWQVSVNSHGQVGVHYAHGRHHGGHHGKYKGHHGGYKGHYGYRGRYDRPYHRGYYSNRHGGYKYHYAQPRRAYRRGYHQGYREGRRDDYRQDRRYDDDRRHNDKRHDAPRRDRSSKRYGDHYVDGYGRSHSGCRDVYKDGYWNDRSAKISGVQCVGPYGDTYIVKGSRRLVRYY